MCAERRRIMLGELLLRAGVITEEQLRTALAEQKKWGGKLGQVLVDLNFLDEGLLVKALSKQLNLPRVDFEGLVIPPEAMKMLGAEFANKRQVLPISYEAGKKQLVVAMSDPGDLGLVDEIEFKTGCRVRVAVAGDRALARAIQQVYFSEAVAAGSVMKEEQPMKMTGPLGNTMVRHVDTVKKEDQIPTDPPPPPVEGGGLAEDKIKRLEQLQLKQVQVLKAVVELLIERGYIDREEYRRKVEK
jgi:hypothetical protein